MISSSSTESPKLTVLIDEADDVKSEDAAEELNSWSLASMVEDEESGYSTPKGKKYRIPKRTVPPPAPKKKCMKRILMAPRIRKELVYSPAEIEAAFVKRVFSGNTPDRNLSPTPKILRQ